MAFINGDTQYGKDRIKKLLLQEGFIDENGNRLRKDEQLIHVGDCGDYYGHTLKRDEETWEFIKDLYDIIIYGNHDWGVWHHDLAPGDFYPPTDRTIEIMNEVREKGVFRNAVSVDGFLVTHAGVHPVFAEGLPSDPELAAERINQVSENSPLLTSISYERWGPNPHGGILWRDVKERLSDQWPQIFGHSRLERATCFNNKHYGIDVGYPSNGRLSGIYTDTRKIVEVNTLLDN